MFASAARSKSHQELAKFLLRACHDLRASARAVLSHSELFAKAARTAADREAEQRLGFIVEGARRIDLLLDGLAAYSVALQTDPSSFQLVRVDVVLRLALAKLDPELRACGADVEVGELPSLRGNPDRLMQVFECLLRNAVDHRGRLAPRIRIDAARHPDGWIFAVRDNGPGVETASLEAIFLPFERAPGAEPVRPGMGLAICRAIVEGHGGRIWAESQPGNGASICFTLPA
jgi:light-regulated signal transduction histidine kinase (bacteriophytochrome)